MGVQRECTVLEVVWTGVSHETELEAMHHTPIMMVKSSFRMKSSSRDVCFEASTREAERVAMVVEDMVVVS